MLKMGSLLVKAEFTGKELLGQVKAGAGGGAKYKNIKLEFYKSFTL